MFAAFHELASGKKVTSVFRHDHTGDAADPDGITELECYGLVFGNGIFPHFSTEDGRFLEALLIAIRQVASDSAKTPSI